MKLFLSSAVLAIVLCACAGSRPAADPCKDEPIKITVSKEIVLAAGALVKTCMAPRDKSFMVKCDQMAIERLVGLINRAAAEGK